MTLCIQCGEQEVSKFKGYAKYKLCKECGIERGRLRREQEDQPWKDARKAAEERKEMRRRLAMEEVSPGTYEKLRGLTNTKKKPGKSRKKDNYKWIPPHMLWCALNPTLTIPEDLMTEEDRREEQEYIEGPGGNPPPLSRNLYKMIKGNPKALDRFVGKIDTLYSQHIKKQENTDREEDSKMIDDIWQIMGESIPLGGIVQKARREGHLPERRENRK